MSQPIRAVKRALNLLRIMNGKAVWTLRDLTAASGLAKPSVFRLLQTLEEEGCVISLPGTRGVYRLCSSVRDLTSGLTDDCIAAEIAAPFVISATKRLRWPLSFAVIDDCHMRVVVCGMPYSRLAARTTTVNRRYWTFTSALGKAYLPFSHPTEQQIVIERAKQLLTEQGASWPYTNQALQTSMRDVRRQGFAVRWAGTLDKTSAVAVPVGRDDELIGALVCSTYPKSLTPARVSELVPDLKGTAELILQAWRRNTAVVAFPFHQPK